MKYLTKKHWEGGERVALAIGDVYGRHEILFASGATLLFEFGEVDVQRSERDPGCPA